MVSVTVDGRARLEVGVVGDEGGRQTCAVTCPGLRATQCPSLHLSGTESLSGDVGRVPQA